MPCYHRHAEAAFQTRREAGDSLVDSFGTYWVGAPAGLTAKARAVLAFQAFIYFLQDNGLTRRTILRPGEQPNASTQVWDSDLTDEGKKLIEAAHRKWLRALDRKAQPTDMSIVAKPLAQIRNPENRATGGQAPALLHLASRKSVSAAKRKKRRKTDEDSRHPPRRAEKLGSELEEAESHVYDKAKWHYEGDFPRGLSQHQAYVHTGMFAGWLMEHDMINEDFLPEAERFKRKEITGPQAYEIWDGGLDSDMLTPSGNQFAREYYGEQFAKDYEDLLVCGLPSFYHVQDTWENYAILKRKMDVRYAAWKKTHGKEKGKSGERR